MMIVLISKRDCEKILSKELKEQNFVVKTFKLENIGEFMGFLGEYYSLEIAADVGGYSRDFSYFMKSLPTLNPEEKQIQDEQGFHKKEIAIYQEIFEKEFDGVAVSWCPKIFLARQDVLVLENLSTRGFKTLPFRFKFKQPHVEEALKTLARFHSCSFVYEEKNPGSKIGSKFKHILTENGFSTDNPWFHTSLNAVEMVAKTRTKYAKSHQQIFVESLNKKLLEMLERLYRPSVDILKVLSHSDVWKNNLMFTFDDEGFENPNNCILLDFQLSKYLSLPIDVLMAIILNTRRSHCEEMMENYLKFYFNRLEVELARNGIDLKSKLSYRKFRESCDYFKLIAVVYNAISIMITHIPISVYAAMTIDEYESFTIRDRNAIVAKLMDEDAFYETCAVEAVEELIEYLYEI